MPSRTGTRSRRYVGLILAAFLAVGSGWITWAQSPPNPDATPSATRTPGPAVAPAAIPSRVLAGRQLVRELSSLATTVIATAPIEELLQTTSDRITTLLEDFDATGTRTWSRRILDDRRAEAAQMRIELHSVQGEVESRSSQIGEGLGRISTEIAHWQATRREPWFDGLPDELTSQVEAVESHLRELQTEFERRLGGLLELQTQLSETAARLDRLTNRIDTEIGFRNRDVLSAESPPLWRAVIHPQGIRGYGDEILDTVKRGLKTVRAHAAKHRTRLTVQCLVWFFLVASLELSRRHRRRDTDREETSAALAILTRPAAAATLLVLALGEVLLFRHAPSAWYDAIILLVLVAAARLLPVLLPSNMQRVLRWLVVIALLHWAAYLVSERLPIDRILWFVVTVVGAVMLPRLGSWTHAAIGGSRPRLAAAEHTLARAAASALLVALLANIIGAFALSILIADGALVSVYLSVLMWTLTEIVDGLVVLLLGSDLGQRARVLRQHGDRVRAVTTKVTGFAAVVGWAAGTAAAFDLLTPLAQIIRGALTASLTVGEISISLGTTLLFAVMLWFSFKLSRLLRFVLAEEVFDRVALPQGVPAALSTLTHYVVVVVGFLIAVAAVGLDLTKFALIAGALGVGIGFGLQTVVNNFVSGLLLLFERPIRIGDKVQVGQMSGTVTAIGIRASTIRTWDGAEVIVPNGSLLESELINWTLSDATRRIEVRVGVAYGTDPEKVLPLLEDVAKSHADVLSTPEPYALFIGFGDSSLDFSLRVWCQFEKMIEVASDLHVAVNRALSDAGIEIPFPQRDLHLKTVAADAARKLEGGHDA